MVSTVQYLEQISVQVELLVGANQYCSQKASDQNRTHLWIVVVVFSAAVLFHVQMTIRDKINLRLVEDSFEQSQICLQRV